VSASGTFRERYAKHRILALLVVLLGVAAWRGFIAYDEGRPADWSRGHEVILWPLVLPGADVGLVEEELESAAGELEAWSAEQAVAHALPFARPLRFRTAEPREAELLPPRLPPAEAGFLERWRATSRFLGYFGERARAFPPADRDASRVFVVLYPHEATWSYGGRDSVGTRRGRLGIVFATDDAADWGNVLALVAHETLHTVGALDHRLADDTIAHPDGYADPGRTPLWPQDRAEVMALGIPTSATDELRVDVLDQVVLGPATAREIGWR
jgi:hypothetical protein